MLKRKTKRLMETEGRKEGIKILATRQRDI
jgi:hypothetical protein